MLKRIGLGKRASKQEAQDVIADDSDRQADIEAARALFTRLTELEAAYDPAVAELYADDGVVIEKTIEMGVEKRAREIPMRKYKAVLGHALRVSQRAQESSSHSHVSAKRVAPGWVIVRSLRRSTKSRSEAPYEILVRREGDGAWRIVKETASLIVG